MRSILSRRLIDRSLSRRKKIRRRWRVTRQIPRWRCRRGLRLMMSELPRSLIEVNFRRRTLNLFRSGLFPLTRFAVRRVKRRFRLILLLFMMTLLVVLVVLPGIRVVRSSNLDRFQTSFRFRRLSLIAGPDANASG